jgi:hypothetical protein
VSTFKWFSSLEIAGFDRAGRAQPVTVGLVKTEAGWMECGLQVGKQGRVVALTVPTIGDLVTDLHEAKVARLKTGGDMLNDKELAGLLAQTDKERARDKSTQMLLALTMPVADGKAMEPATKEDYSREFTITGLSNMHDILPEFCEQATHRSFEGDEWDEWANLSKRLLVLARACRMQVVDVLEALRVRGRGAARA